MPGKPPSDPTAKAARQTALRLLTGRDHCSGQLRTKLAERGYSTEVIEALIADLQREKLLNDARYAENFVAYYAGRGQGPVRIESELRSLRLDPELIGRCLATAQDWPARARAAREKKFGTAVPHQYAEKAKQARFLQYRGFTGGQVRAALETDIDIDSES